MVAGSIYMFAGSTAPSGFLICDGSAVSRSTYSALFEAIGTIFGAGDGSTTFNLPDLSGRVAVGRSVNRLLGSTGGEESHALISNEMATHNHEYPQHGHNNTIEVSTPVLTHTVSQQPAYKYSNPAGSNRVSTSAAADRTSYGSTSSANASRTTDLSIADHPATACTMSGGVLDSDPSTTDSTGSGTAHNNMQPYVVMNYIICTGE